MRKRLSFAVIGIFAVALTGCPRQMRVAQINRDPARYYNKEVTVTGRVVSSYGVASTGAYEIDDGTGRIWVFTDKFGVPTKDGYVGVTGKIYPGVTYEGRTFGIGIRETRRRKHPTT
jgi:hypothetical protein